MYPWMDMAEDMRGPLMRFGILLAFLAPAVFPLSADMLRWLQARNAMPLAAFGIADIFLAQLTLAAGVGAVVALPYAVWKVLAALSKISPELTRRTRWVFWLASILLFFAGVGFCLQIILPFGSRFLLGFGSESLQPVICVREFVSFCLAFVLGFGILFELPLAMVLLAWLGLVRSTFARRFRRNAFFLIIVVSAVVTPTPDMVNLLLLAVPLSLLFELGIIGMRLCERRPTRSAARSESA